MGSKAEVDMTDVLEVSQNAVESRFEVSLGDQVGVIEYSKHGLTYDLYHTEVPREYRGRGIADRLALVTLETIKAESGKVIASCPFIKSYIRRHPEYQPLLQNEE